jgi:hypothetical protein
MSKRADCSTSPTLSSACVKPPVTTSGRHCKLEWAATSDTDELLGQVKQAAEAAAKDIRHMSEVERGKRGIHLRLRTMTVGDVAEQLIVAHAEAHVGASPNTWPKLARARMT